MSFAEALIAVLLLGCSVIPVSVLAVMIRRQAYPDLDGATAVLASAILALSIATVAFELVGIPGWLGRPALVAIGAAAAAAAIALRRAAPATRVDTTDTPRRHLTAVWGTVASLGIAAVVVAQWGARTVGAVRTGVTDFDSLVYHLPYAARIAQTGATGRLMYVMGDACQAFHSLGSETLQAVGMIATDRTALVPWFNLGWLLLALLSGWCLLRRAGAAALGLVLVGAVFATPLIVAAGAGTAKSDVAAAALLVAAAALLVATEGQPRGVVLAGLAAGLALGAKENALGPVIGLVIVVAFVTGNHRVRGLLEFTGGAVATGGFWFVRNLVHSGNPFPSAHLPVLPSPRFPIGETFDHRLSEYLTDTQLWRDIFLPGLGDAVGRGAVLVGLLAAVAVVVALVRGGRQARGFALAAIFAAAFFLITPFTAPGAEGTPEPSLYTANTRYGVGALLLCLFAGALALSALGRRAVTVGVALAGVCAVLTLSTTGPLAAWPDAHRSAGAVIAVVLLVAVVAVAQPPVRRAVSAAPRIAVLPVGVVVALVLAAGLGEYADRYGGGPAPARPPRPNLIAFGSSVAPARIGLVGIEVGYPLVGDRLENTVRFVGVRAPHAGIRDAASCGELRRALAAERLDYVIVGRYQSDADQTTEPPALAWLRDAPDLTVVAQNGTTTVFSVDPNAPVTGAPCPT